MWCNWSQFTFKANNILYIRNIDISLCFHEEFDSGEHYEVILLETGDSNKMTEYNRSIENQLHNRVMSIWILKAVSIGSLNPHHIIFKWSVFILPDVVFSTFYHKPLPMSLIIVLL